MKKFLLIILSAIALVGCTLEEQVLSSSEPDKFYQTVPQCLTGLNGCYLPLRSIYSNADYFEACEVATDLIYHNTSSYYDAQCNYTQSQARIGTTIWTQCYLGVMRCNAIYYAIEKSPLTLEEKMPLMAEAVVLRAFYYYILTINFGDVPYYFEPVTDANNDRIAQMPRKPAKELRQILIDELEDWLLVKQALPYIKTYDPANNYRIGAMVGLTIGGKLAMWNKRFDKALEFFAPIDKVYTCASIEADELVGETGRLEEDCLMGYSVSDIMFRNRYTDESIFELPAYSKDYGLKVTTYLASRCTPSRSSTASESALGDEETEDEEGLDLSQKDDFYNGIRIPELGVNARTTSPYRPTCYFYKTILPYNADGSRDKRRSVYDTAKAGLGEIVEVEDGGGYLAWCYKGWKDKTVDINDPSNPPGIFFFNSTASATGAPFLGDKFWCPGMIYNQDSNNLKIFRYAHVVLDMAEANMRCGHWDLARNYLNAVKRRAGRTDYIDTSAKDEIDFMEKLQQESARELFGEFTRRHNLVRWGIWYDQIVKYSKYPSGSNEISTPLVGFVMEGPCREYYPIPDQQIVLSNYNLDNKEYDKYGL